MEIFALSLLTYLVSVTFNTMYMIIKNNPMETRYLLVVLVPIVNTLYLICLLFNFKNIKSVFNYCFNSLKKTSNVFKEIIEAFKEI